MMVVWRQNLNTVMFQGKSRSETWYAVFDHGTNYCNLHNLLTGIVITSSHALYNVEAKYFYIEGWIYSGFPPIREIRENFENFPVWQIKKKDGVFSQNQGKIFKSGRQIKKQQKCAWLLVWLCGKVLLLGSVYAVNWCF